MTRFEIRDDFYLDGKSFKILSGAIHYFRVPPEDWYHSLYNLKALGFNTVETYVAWNLHEPREGEFHFEELWIWSDFYRQHKIWASTLSFVRRPLSVRNGNSVVYQPGS